MFCPLELKVSHDAPPFGVYEEKKDLGLMRPLKDENMDPSWTAFECIHGRFENNPPRILQEEQHRACLQI